MSDEKKQWGGKREGAGRPSTLKDPKRVTIWLEAEQLAWVKTQGEQGEVIRRLIDPDLELNIKNVFEILNTEITFYDERGKGISGRSQDYEAGWLAALLDFRRTLLISQYAIKNSPPKTGWMGDSGGLGCDPID